MSELECMRESDCQAAVELWASVVPFDQLGPQLLEEKVWGDPDFRPELALVCREQAQLLGFGVAVCRQKDGNTIGFIKLLAVAPDVQRAGIGTAIYEQLENRCREFGAVEMRIAESAPNYLQPGVDERSFAAISFFAKHGYANIGRACNMTVDLSDWASSYRGKILSDDDCGDYRILRATPMLEAATQEFVTRHWPPWWGEVSVALRNDPVSLFVAVDDGQVIGFAAYDGNNLGTGWFGPMGTCPQQRGRGIGRQLLAHCLDDMRTQGYTKATIPWVGPVEFYSKECGAVVDRTFVRLAKQLT